MKVLTRFTMLACFLTIACSSVQTYFKDRGNDALDIVNVGVEKNIYGVRIKIFYPLFGYQKSSNGVGFGLRQGYLGKYFTGDKENKISIVDLEEGDDKLQSQYEILPGDSNFIAFTNYHKINDSKDLRSSKKQFLEFIPTQWDISTHKTRVEYQGSTLDKKRSIKGIYRSGATDESVIEISIGAHYGFRIGINLFEIFDFIVGILGFDLLSDDTPYIFYLLSKNPKAHVENVVLKSDRYTIDKNRNNSH